MMKRIAIVLAAAAVVAGCTESVTGSGEAGQVVIEAYLFAGEPVTDVRVTSAVELGAADTVGVPVDNAKIVLIKGGVRYPLTLAASNDGSYRYEGTSLTVNEGDVFDLEVTHGGTVATARTVVPIRPASLTVSADSVVVPSFGAGFGPGTFDALSTQLIARWPNAAGELYYVTVASTEESPTEIDGPFRGRGFRRFIFPPIAADSFAVSPLSLAVYGRHEIRVYRVNNEYAALYESRMQDSRDLNEPATNIHGGLGVFSAFSSRVATFRAVAQK